MNLYDAFMKPFEKKALHGLRKKYIHGIKGKVLEIGGGTGINIAHYNNVDLVMTDLEVSEVLKNRLKDSNLKYEICNCGVTDLPFEDHSFDYVVSTLVFCSVEDVAKGLKEIQRVLKTSGRLIFIEHVHPKEQPWRYIFNILTPLWKRLASGCHLNRDYIKALESENFILEDKTYVFGTKFVAGSAKIK